MHDPETSEKKQGEWSNGKRLNWIKPLEITNNTSSPPKRVK